MSESTDDDDRLAGGGTVNVQRFLLAALAMLQIEPQRYKLFGVYWWAIKAMLRRLGYGPDNLYMLGTYQDATTAAMVPKMGLEDTIRAAAAEFAQNASFQHSDGQIENEDGELVTIFDEDARF